MNKIDEDEVNDIQKYKIKKEDIISKETENKYLYAFIKNMIEESLKLYPKEKISLESLEINIDMEKLPEKLIEEYIENFDLIEILEKKQLSEGFMDKYEDKLDWEDLAYHQENLSEEFLERHKEKLRWNDIQKFQNLSEEFIEKYIDNFHWFHISHHQKLSESFIIKHKDEVNWNMISQYQDLSLKFIKINDSDIDFNALVYNNKIKDNNVWLYVYRLDEKKEKEISVVWTEKHIEIYNILEKINEINEDKDIKTKIDLLSKRYSNYSYEDLLIKIEKIKNLKINKNKNKKLREEQLKKMKDNNKNKKVENLIIDEDLVF